MDTITVKIYRETHEKTQQAQIKEMAKDKQIISYMAFLDDVIIEGLKAKGYKRFPGIGGNDGND